MQTTIHIWQGFRLDVQSNGVFKHNGIDYVQLAVQQGKLVYASALIPFKEFVSAGGIRKALYVSLDTRKVVPFELAPKTYKGVYKWMIVGAAAVLMVVGI